MELELDTAAGKCFLFANSSESICAGRVRCIVSACTLLQPKRTQISAPKRSRGDGRNLRAQRFVPLLGRLPQRTKFPALRHWTTIPAPGPNRESGFDTLNIYRLRPGSSDTCRNYRRQTADRSGRSEGSCQLPEVTQLEDDCQRAAVFPKRTSAGACIRGGPERWFKVGTAGPTGPTPSILHQCRQAVGCRWGFFSIWPSDYYE